MTQATRSEDLKDLPTGEAILRTTSSQLIKHFRGLESARILNQQEASKLIGCVKKIVSVARGEVVD